MRFVVIMMGFLFISYAAIAQGDMLFLKKKGKVVKTFYTGSVIDYDIGMGAQEAQIENMRDDTLFLIQYQVQRMMSTFGTIIWDTVAAYRSEIGYNEIQALSKPRTGAFTLNTMGATLFGSGALLTVGGLLTRVFAKKDTRYYASSTFLITSAALTATGYLLMLNKPEKKWVIGKKYSLQYIGAK